MVIEKPISDESSEQGTDNEFDRLLIEKTFEQNYENKIMLEKIIEMLKVFLKYQKMTQNRTFFIRASA